MTMTVPKAAEMCVPQSSTNFIEWILRTVKMRLYQLCAAYMWIWMNCVRCSWADCCYTWYEKTGINVLADRGSLYDNYKRRREFVTTNCNVRAQLISLSFSMMSHNKIGDKIKQKSVSVDMLTSTKFTDTCHLFLLLRLLEEIRSQSSQRGCLFHG